VMSDATTTPATGSVRVDGDGRVRHVVLDNPKSANAITLDMHRRLTTIWRELAEDDDVAAVVLTGAGSAFSAGGDMAMLRALSADELLRRRVFAEAEAILDEMLRFPKPLVAAVNGFAVGLAASLAISSDVVLIAESAYLADPHVAIGVVAGDGGAALWPQLTCSLRTREWLYTGSKISAAEAVDCGLASRVVAADAVMEEADRVAAKLADLPSRAFSLTKRAVNQPLLETTRRVMPYAIAAEHLTFLGPDLRDAVDRFSRR
jgi:enoyl-CoA hydratase